MHLSLLKWHYCHLKHLKDRSKNVQNRRSGELPSGPLKTYKMMLDLMDVIFTILQQIWLWKKIVPVPQIIMGYHTGNVYYGVLINAQVLV